MGDRRCYTAATLTALVLAGMASAVALASDGTHCDNKVASCVGVSATRMTVCAGETVGLEANATHPGGKKLTFRWTTTGGKIVGSGAKVTLDTSGLSPGKYTVTAHVSDDFNPETYCSVDVNVVTQSPSTSPPN